VDRIVRNVSSVLRREEGQTLVEYALILALIAVALVTALGLLEGGISTEFSKITAALP
jgi:pilus assembly protein Flp/PilA